MPLAFEVKPSGLPFKTHILNCFTYLLWCYFLTDSELSCLAILAKPYPVSGPTYMPLIPNQHHCTSICAAEVLGTISSEAVWGASPIPAAQPVALFARPDQEFSCGCYGILISVGFL